MTRQDVDNLYKLAEKFRDVLAPHKTKPGVNRLWIRLFDLMLELDNQDENIPKYLGLRK